METLDILQQMHSLPLLNTVVWNGLTYATSYMAFLKIVSILLEETHKEYKGRLILHSASMKAVERLVYCTKNKESFSIQNHQARLNKS